MCVYLYQDWCVRNNKDNNNNARVVIKTVIMSPVGCRKHYKQNFSCLGALLLGCCSVGHDCFFFQCSLELMLLCSDDYSN